VTIEVYPGLFAFRWYWRLKAKNGEIVADGSEAYYSKSNAKRAAKSVVKSLKSSKLSLKVLA
jgi:uncharacterized protein YegP (UPF0339 family)